jgi:lipopolysaccharide export system protein LptA
MNRTLLISCVTLAATGLTAISQTNDTPPAPKPAGEAGALKKTETAAAADPKKAGEPSGQPAGKDEKEGGKDAPKTTEITAEEAAFDQRAHVGVFTINVVVVNPQFNVTCDKLTAYLRHEDPKTPPSVPVKPSKSTPVPGGKTGKGKATPAPVKPAATPAPAPTAAKPGAATDPAAPPQKMGGLQKALAEGNVTITQDKTDADGHVEHDTGHAKRALYDADTGDVTLYGKPDVQQGGNHCIALDENTVIIMNRDGHMTVHGPHKTVLEDTSTSAPDPKTSNAR